MVKKKIIIYDSLNKIAWVDRQRGTGKKTKSGKPTDKGVYGKDARRFKSNVQTRAHAMKLSRKYNGRVYDKYFGEYLKTKRSKK